MWTWPNILTLSRLALLPFIIALFYLESTMGAAAAWLCLGLYALGALSDFLDGWLARRFGQVSPFGTFLDPIADKIFVASMLVLLVGFDRLPGLWMAAVIIILAREFLVAGLREFLGPHDLKLPVTKLAKWKTAAQMLATGILIIGPYVHGALAAGQGLLALAALLTVITGWIYLKSGLDHMKKIA